MSAEEPTTQRSSTDSAAEMEHERITLDLVKRKRLHHLYLPVQSGVNKFLFVIDTGNDRSVI